MLPLANFVKYFFKHSQINNHIKPLIKTLLLLSITFSSASANCEQSGNNKTLLLLDNISQKIDSRIASMQLIAKSLANDPHIHDWVNNGFSSEKEHLLIEKLGFYVDEYRLTSASFADKNTHKYWNHEGFLRILDKKIDTWYFNYLASGSQDLISVYHDKNKHRVDIYVNYQQTDSNGLSGIATSFDGVLDMLRSSELSSKGRLYLVSGSGEIKLAAKGDVKENTPIQSLYKHHALIKQFAQNAMPNKSDNSTKQTLNPSGVEIRLIPHMTWYVVFVQNNE